MTFDEKAVGAAVVMFAYGMTGVLSMIPAIQEIRLDRKLNEDKTKLEKNGFHPDLVARHVQSNEAIFIGCGQDMLDLVRQGLTQGGVPFITITSNMFKDESKRPPYFYTIIIRDIDEQRAADLLKEFLQEHDKGEQEYELEEEDLERQIVGPEDAIDEQEKDSRQEDGGKIQQEEDNQNWEEEGEYSSKDDKKKTATKKKAEKRKERRREIGYREAYAIRAVEIEAQCERYAKAELMRRELEKMKLSGEEMSDTYSRLKDQYRNMNDEIQAHHDNFYSIGKGGWKEYAAEAAKRVRNASVEDLKERTWDIPDSNDYLKQNPDGSYSAYNRKEKKAYLDRKFFPSVDESTQKSDQEHRQEKTPIALSKTSGEMPLRQIANGYTLKSVMEPQQGRRFYIAPPQNFGAKVYHVQSKYKSSVFGAESAGNPAPMCGGILVRSGVYMVSADAYRRKGSAGQEAFQATANTQPAAMAGSGIRASSMFTGSTAETQAASVKAVCRGVLQEKSKIVMDRAEDTSDSQQTLMGMVQANHQDSLRKVEAMNSRASHAALNMAKNRYFAMMARQGARTAVQAAAGETEAGRMTISAMYAVKLPAHMVKQQFFNMGRTSIDQGDAVMTALNSHIIRFRAESACTMQGGDLEKFAIKSGLDLAQLRTVQGNRSAMERLIAGQYSGTFRTPGKDDMEGLIKAMGIRGDLQKGDTVGTEDILTFLSHHKESILAERARALGNAEGCLDGLTESQKRLVESLFSRNGFLDKTEMKEFLAKNGVSLELADKLVGGNWAADGDILMALNQAGISEDKTRTLMKELKGISMEDRAAMMGLFQLYAGDSLDGFDMDKFRQLLNVLDVDQSLKDELNNNFIHLSHMSIGDIKKLLVKYKGNPETEAFLNRLMNEKICLVLGRNREMSRFELLNGMENILFKMARGTDAMTGFSQVMGLGRGMVKVTKSGYQLLYHMAFRRITSPISIGKLKVTPANLTGANIKAATVGAVKQTKVAATFSQMLNRRVPKGLQRAANHIMHPGKFIGRTILKKAELILVRHGVNVAALKSGVWFIAGKVTAFAAAVSEILLVVIVIILIIIALLMVYESIDFGSSNENNYSAAYVSTADGKDAFVQEVVDMLRGYTDGFIDEINNAQYNRGMYAGMNGYNTNEDVGAFEVGAYQVVFRGPDGEPIDDITSVDLNNSKDIISMASVFIPTVFNKPGENASQKLKEEYEKDKEHFMDYCSFLWAASHQISIEEYHPGNATNPDANDNSGLQTDAQTGKCQMDFTLGGDQGAGVNWWIGAGAAPTSSDVCDICKKTDWYEADTGKNPCVAKPVADPCTHGHWQTVTTAIKHKACVGHHHSCSKHDYWYSCLEKGKEKWDKDVNVYKRIWVCDGHMGAVVYATIGRISRMPNFGLAEDYDFDNPETYGGSGGIYSYFGGTGGEGNTAFKGDSYSLTDAQLKYLAAMCMGEQRSCATNEVTMRYQASLMANVYELYGKRKGLSIYEYLTLLPTQKKNGVRGWFATTSHTYADKNAASVSSQCVEWIKDVLCNGNRITKANEQGTLITGFVKAVYKGKEYTGNAMKNESIYVSGETILYTSGGQACLFEAFPGGHPAGCGTPVVDPFAIIIN